MQNCGFIGLGQMGAPIAAHVLKGQPLTVVAIEAEQQERFKQLGATVATETTGVAACDLVFLCLPNGKVVEDVIFGAKGLASVLRPGATIVDTSTIEYQHTLGIAERLKALGVQFLDAPVSGMHARAVAGTLTVMCGGPATRFEELKPYFACFANKILHMGDVGAGQLAKLINQLLFDINAAALAEILPLAVKLGLEPEKTSEIINSGTGRSYASEFFLPNILKGEFSKGYPMEAAYKDLISGVEISVRQGIPTPVLAAATAVYQSALLAGDGSKDKGGMICHIEKRLGVTFRSKQKGSAA